MKESIIYQGQRTASHYHYGELNDEIIEKIQWYNIVSEFEVIVVDNLEDLPSYFPYKVNYETLVDADARKDLESGTYIVKEGFVEELDLKILGAIFPIKGENELIGFIYIYVPLAAIQDVFKDSIPILLIVGVIFFLILFSITNKLSKSLFRPLKDLQQHSQEVSEGNYSSRLITNRDDEIGQLTKAFNKMSLSLEQQEVRKKEFTSNIVHELRTPLTYIGGYTQVLKQKIFTSPEEAESYLTTIEKETVRLNKLINDLVELNHLQEDFYMMDKQPIAIAQLLYDTLDLFTILIAEKKLELTLNIEDESIISGDPQRIQQVFYNILDNAIKYTAKNEVIAIKLERTENLIQFEVTNHGLLINKEDLERIGERFFRTDKARNRTTGGYGLGISIVKEIVRLHDGTFTMNSDLSDGTKVTIRLPMLVTEIEEEVQNEKL